VIRRLITAQPRATARSIARSIRLRRYGSSSVTAAVTSNCSPGRGRGSDPHTEDLIFPSTLGGLRDPNNLAKQWRQVRGDLGETLEKVTGHSFRKTLASLVTTETSDPSVAADVLGHASTSTTLRHYISRHRSHPEVADLMQRAVTAKTKSGP
jgi:integrase